MPETKKPAAKPVAKPAPKPTKKLTVGKKKKVAICGFAPSSMHLAPYDDDEFEIWGCNEFYSVAERVDVLFEIHSRKFLVNKKRNKDHLKWLTENKKIPVFMQQKYDDIPASIKYPLKELTERYGNYFTNSISYMLALAIDLEFEEIHVYGVDMATSEEYGPQRPSVEYFLGICKAAEIMSGKCKLYIPPECDLLKTFFLYGFDDDKITEMKLKMESRKAELQGRLNQYKAVADSNIAAMNQMLGAIDDVGYWGRNYHYGDGGEDAS